MTALQCAESAGHVLVVRELENSVDNGSNTDQQQGNGMTPLMHEVQDDDYDGNLDYITGSRTEINRSTGGRTIMQASILRRFEEVQNFVDNGFNIDQQQRIEMTALMHAVQTNDYEMTGFLISLGANVNLEDNNGSTALIFAAQQGSIRLVRIILSAGSRIDHHQNDGLSAIMYA